MVTNALAAMKGDIPLKTVRPLILLNVSRMKFYFSGELLPLVALNVTVLKLTLAFLMVYKATFIDMIVSVLVYCWFLRVC